MASSNSTTTPTTPTTPNTTFVQADPSNFRAVVQKLTGASDHPKLPLSHLPSSRQTTTTTATKKPLFKLHERRNHTAKKLEHLTIASSPSSSSLSLSDRNIMMLNLMNMNIVSPSSCSSVSPYVRMNKMMIASSSPVSPLDVASRASPRSPPSQHVVEEEEERVVVAEKGFYLRPISASPLGTPRGSDPPELLPLFPLHSPNSTRNHQEQP